MNNAVHNDWKIGNIAEYSNLITKGATPTTYGYDYVDTLVEGGARFIRGNNASMDGKFDGSDVKYICKKANEKIKRSKLSVGDVILSIVGSVGTSFQVNENVIPSNINQNVALIRPNSELDSGYLKQIVVSKIIQDQIAIELTVQAQPSLSLKQVGDFRISIPPKPEQQKIASILTSVDKVIENVESQTRKLQDLKKGMMQELLTKGIGHTEFKDSPAGRIPKMWAALKLDELVASSEGGVSVNSENKPKQSGEWGILKTSSVNHGHFIPEENKVILEGELARAKVNPRKDCILFSRMNTPLLVGNSGYVEETYKDLFLPDRLWQLDVKDRSSVNVRFLSYILASGATRKIISDVATGTSGSMKNISKPNLLSIQIPLPPKEEQDVITSTIKSIDERLAFKNHKLEKLKQLKKALMQDLLTGKVRVKME